MRKLNARKQNARWTQDLHDDVMELLSHYDNKQKRALLADQAVRVAQGIHLHFADEPRMAHQRLIQAHKAAFKLNRILYARPEIYLPALFFAKTMHTRGWRVGFRAGVKTHQVMTFTYNPNARFSGVSYGIYWTSLFAEIVAALQDAADDARTARPFPKARMAEFYLSELASAYATTLGKPPTKTRDGNFCKLVQMVFNAARGSGVRRAQILAAIDSYSQLSRQVTACSGSRKSAK